MYSIRSKSNSIMDFKTLNYEWRNVESKYIQKRLRLLFFLSVWLGPKWLMKSISHPSSEGMRGLYHLDPTISIFSFGKWCQKINHLELKPIFINSFVQSCLLGACFLLLVSKCKVQSAKKMQSAKKKEDQSNIKDLIKMVMQLGFWHVAYDGVWEFCICNVM